MRRGRTVAETGTLFLVGVRGSAGGLSEDQQSLGSSWGQGRPKSPVFLEIRASFGFRGKKACRYRGFLEWVTMFCLPECGIRGTHLESTASNCPVALRAV